MANRGSEQLPVRSGKRSARRPPPGVVGYDRGMGKEGESVYCTRCHKDTTHIRAEHDGRLYCAWCINNGLLDEMRAAHEAVYARERRALDDRKTRWLLVKIFGSIVALFGGVALCTSLPDHPPHVVEESRPRIRMVDASIDAEQVVEPETTEPVHLAPSRTCDKGCPCGNTCISCEKTCHVGSGTAHKRRR